MPLTCPQLTGKEAPVYSRLSAPNTTRLEAILSSLCKGQALTYSSGLSAFHAMCVLLRPKVIAIGDGYHGCHGVLSVLSRLYDLKKVDLHDESTWDAAGLGEGDIVHVETPLNPSGECFQLAEFAKKAKKRGAFLTVDATFGPPGLQDPFEWGADIIMHSGTKYVGGHSDMLCGVLVVRNQEWWRKLYVDRLFLGSVMGSFEGWLGVRSIRTLEVRVQRQSANAEKLVAWLDELMKAGEQGADVMTDDAIVVKATVDKLQHASLQAKRPGMDWVKEQMPGGFGPVFSIWMKDREMARRLPSKLKCFHHATSLGGVESLIEWRRMSDSTVDDRVMRLSIGIEGQEDLQADLIQGLRAVASDMGLHARSKL